MKDGTTRGWGSLALAATLVLLAGACGGPSKKDLSELADLEQQVAAGAGIEEQVLQTQEQVVRLRRELRSIQQHPLRRDAVGLYDRVLQESQALGLRLERFEEEGSVEDALVYRALVRGKPERLARWLTNVADWRLVILPSQVVVSPDPTVSFRSEVIFRLPIWATPPEAEAPPPTPGPEGPAPDESTARRAYFLRHELARIEDARKFQGVLRQELTTLQAIRDRIEGGRIRCGTFLETLQGVLDVTGAAGALEDIRAGGEEFQITVVAPTQESEQYLVTKLSALTAVETAEVIDRKDLRYGSRIQVRATLK